MKRTYQPNRRKRKRTHGFLVRMSTRTAGWFSSVAVAKGGKRPSVTASR